jgi:dipicolinate synthase subunit B
MEKIRVGFAFCGSYCTYGQVMPALQETVARFGSVLPILSEHSAETDSRFGTAQAHLEQIEEICGQKALLTIPQVEPIGPKKRLDLLIVAPCTGNTLAKLAAGITDTTVTMAVKSHLRNGRPVVLAPATNDGLSASLRNIGELLCRKHIYFVPFRQDDPAGKPNSLVAEMSLIPEAADAALYDRQLQPVLLPSPTP